MPDFSDIFSHQVRIMQCRLPPTRIPQDSCHSHLHAGAIWSVDREQSSVISNVQKL